MQENIALRRSEERLAKLFRSSPAAIALVRLGDGVLLDVNQSYERMFGWRRDEVIGQTAEALGVWAVPAERARFRELLAAKGRVADFESKARRKNGELFDSLVASEVIDEEGERIALVVVLDVTQRKRAEESRALLAAVVESSTDAIIVSNPELDIVSWNAGAERMFGWSAAEAVGRKLTLIVPVERRHETDLNTERLEQREAPPPFETVRCAKDGRRLEVQIGLSGVYDREGRLQLVTGIFRDITERKHAEAALRESEQRFKALVDLSSDWYWVSDAEHRFTFREGEILRRMGIPPQDDYGKRRWEMEFLNMDERAWAAHRAALERREEFRDLLLERRSPDGRVHWATISGRPLYDAQGHFAGYHGTGRDVTLQVLAEQRLRKFNLELERKVVERTAELDAANRELEAFTYSASHDLRAPLRAIEGFSRLLEERHAAALGAEAQGYLRRVRAAARRMNQLIDDLLAFSRVARGELRRRSVDLSELARAVAKEIASGAPERRVEWRIEDGLTAHADEGLMRVVLENLLGNAWKYTGKTPQAVIEFGRSGAHEFRVRDNGVGFDPAHVEELFQPFRRLHGEQEFEGSGVGLATVKRVIERHGGSVRGEGAVDAGATFYFALPDASAA
jgi:PAS domain S-box-containing protein